MWRGICLWHRLTSAALSHLGIKLLPGLLRTDIIGVNGHPSCVDIGKEATGSLSERAHKVVEALALACTSGAALGGPLIKEASHIVAQLLLECIQAPPLIGVEGRPIGIQIMDHRRHVSPQCLGELLKLCALCGCHLLMLGLQVSELLVGRLTQSANCRYPAVVRLAHRRGNPGHVLS